MIDKNFRVEIDKKKELVRLYYANYEKFIKENEPSKASEMLWGIINNLIWVLGKFYFGKEIESHRDILTAIEQILMQNNFPPLVRARYMADANSLHKNFFHNHLEPLNFNTYRVSVEKLIDILQQILTKRLKKEGY